MKLEKVTYKLSKCPSRFEISKLWIWKYELDMGINISLNPGLVITNKLLRITIGNKNGDYNTFILKN